MPLISSRRNPLVRRLKALTSHEGRNEYSMFLLEGTHLLQEVLKKGLLPKEIVVTKPWLKKNSILLSEIKRSVQIHLVTKEVLHTSLTTVSPDGVATLLPLDALPSIKNRQSKFILALDRLQDPGNLGMLLRTALAGDFEEVWLASGADPLNPKALRASAGAVLSLPHCRLGPSEKEGIEKLAQKLQQASGLGFQVVASLVPGVSLPKTTIPYWELDWIKPSLVVLGNEGKGLHPCLQACCTHLVTIPHSDSVESLNVAAAAVPLLLERRRATMTSAMRQ